MLTGPAKIVAFITAICAALCLGACGFIIIAPLYFSEGRIEPAGVQAEKRVKMMPRSGIRRLAYEEIVATGDILDQRGRRVAHVTVDKPVPEEGEAVLYLSALPEYHVLVSSYRYSDNLIAAAVFGIAASAFGYWCRRATRKNA